MMLETGAHGTASAVVRLASGQSLSLVASCDPASADGAGGPPGEDRVGARQVPDGRVLLWVIDGATSVDPAFQLDGQLGGAWYASALHEALARDDGPVTMALAARLERAIRSVATRFGQAMARAPWPEWAWPLASISLLQIEAGADGAVAVRGLHLGDSPVYLVGADVRTVFRQGPIPEARRDDTTEQAEADMMARLRARRIAQHRGAPPPIAGLDPGIAGAAAATTASLVPGDRLVLISDGLVRLYEEYGLIDEAACLKGVAGGAYRDLLAQMRAFERQYALQAARMFKASDDCAMIMVSLVP